MTRYYLTNVVIVSHSKLHLKVTRYYLTKCSHSISFQASSEGDSILFNKMLERVLDARIRRRVECDFGEEQQGFMKGRGTADGVYVLRQMVEKRLEVQGSMALGFVDLEKAFDTVPREMVMATLRWMGIPEAEVRMVEGTYE